MALRMSTEEDYLEDLFFAVRELKRAGMADTTIRRYVTNALNDVVPTPIRDRIAFGGDGIAGGEG